MMTEIILKLPPDEVVKEIDLKTERKKNDRSNDTD